MSLEIDPQSQQETGESVRDMVAAAGRSVQVKLEVPVTRTPKALAEAPSITPRRKRPGSRGRWTRRIIALAVLAIGGTAVAIYYEPLQKRILGGAGSRTNVALHNVQTYAVKRGELRVTMVEEGKLRAVNNSTIRMGVSGKIMWLAEAGARVKKGDKLAVLDVKQYEDQKKTMDADLETQLKQLEIAEKQVPMAEWDGEAAKATAKNAYDAAKVAMTQYRTVDTPKKLNEFETAINEARTKLSDQQKKRLDLQTQLDQMLNEGPEKMKLQSDLAIAKQQEASLKRVLQTAEDQRKVFRAYNYPQDLSTKEGLVTKAEVDMKKAEVNAENNVLAKKADVARIKNSIARVQNNIRQYEDIIAKATAFAPTDGLVFYGGPDLQRYGISPEQIRVGADWYSNYPIMSIPDLSSFLVEVPIAEVYRGRVTNGIPATVTIDAVPGLVLEGKLATVASVSRPKYQFDNSSPPVYDATISLAVADERMVAGMTVRVEIVTGVLQDVLYVPVEAVFNEEGKTAAFFWVKGSQPNEGHVEIRPVLTGQASDHFVELKDGVHENDLVLLSRPAAYVTPPNYRELVDAMFPANTTVAAAPATAPAMAPADAAPMEVASPTTRPAPRRGRPSTAPGNALSAMPAPAVN